MAPSTRHTISVRLRERQLVETLLALQAVDLATKDVAGQAAIASAIVLFHTALIALQERSV